MQLVRNAATQVHLIDALVLLVLLIMYVQVTHVSTTLVNHATIILMDCIATDNYVHITQTVIQETAPQVFACHLVMEKDATTKLNIVSTIMIVHLTLEFALQVNALIALQIATATQMRFA